MKFEIPQKNFLEAIQTVQRAVSNKNTLPILSGIMITAFDGVLLLTATDLELGIELETQADIREEGQIVLPANHLASIVRELPNKTVSVECDMAIHSARIECGKSRFKVNGFPADDFPTLPKVTDGIQVQINQGILQAMIGQVKISTSTDETQLYLNGALLRVDGGQIKMAATNSYRLSLRISDVQSDAQVEAILPNKALDEMARLLGDVTSDVTLIITPNQIKFDLGGLTINSRLIEGRFPNYDPVIPKDTKTHFAVNRKDLLSAAKRVSLIAVQNSNIVKASISTDGIMVLDSMNAEIGQAHEEIELHDFNGDAVEINFNAGYLMDGLKVIETGKVQFQMGSKLQPFIVRPVGDEQYTYVISPVRS